jgi:hypothetical protein
VLGPRAQRYVLAIVGWLGCSAALAVFFGLENVIPDLELLRDGSTTVGHVVERDRQHHDRMVVRYSVNAREYSVARTFVVRPNRPKDALSIGDAVTVYYLPNAPDVATLGDPAELLPSDLMGAALGTVMFSTGIVATVLWHTRKRRSGPL